MDIDLFVIVERIFQGTVLFVFRFFATAWGCFMRPVRHALQTFARFKSGEAREVGPVTFAVVCLLLFWSTLIGFLVGLGPDFHPQVLAAELKALDASPLRAPIILIAISTITSIVILDLAYRMQAYFLLSAGVIAKGKTEDVSEKLGAVGLYTAGTSALIFPLCAGIAALTAWLAPGFVAGIKSDTIAYGIMGIIGLSPVLSATAVSRFVMQVIQPLPGHRLELAGVSFVTGLFAMGLAIVAGFFAFMQLQSPLSESGKPLISYIDCKATRDGKETLAVVQIKNTGSRPAIVRADAWSIRLTADYTKEALQERSTTAAFGDKINPVALLLEPGQAISGIIWFPVRGPAPPGGWSGWGTCKVFTDDLALSFESTEDFGNF